MLIKHSCYGITEVHVQILIIESGTAFGGGMVCKKIGVRPVVHFATYFAYSDSYTI